MVEALKVNQLIKERRKFKKPELLDNVQEKRLLSKRGDL
jgi:hypothetical protein